MKQPVKYAKLHTSVYFPGVGDMTSTLPPSTKNFGIELTFDGDTGVLEVACKGKVALIPSANIQVMVLADAVK